MSGGSGVQERTQAFRRLGILELAEILKREDVETASNQMEVVCLFLTSDAKAASAPPPDVRVWAELGLRAAARDWRETSDAPGWAHLLEESTTAVVWDPFLEFSNLLSATHGGMAFRRTADRLRRKGVHVSWDTLVDLRDDFTMFHLPRAVRSFNPRKGSGHETSWLATVFYRYAVRSMSSQRVQEEQLRFLHLFVQSPETPEDVAIRVEREGIRVSLSNAMEELPNPHKTALRMYFGFDDREATLREIGSATGLTRFKARSLVVAALARLMLETGASERLRADQRAFARKCFVEGMSPADAAREIGAKVPEMKQGLSKFFDAALRQRTSKALEDPKRETDPLKMDFRHSGFSNHESSASTDSMERIDRAVSLLSRVPELLPERGVLKVVLDDDKIDIADVREAVCEKTLEVLAERGIGIDWLLSGPAPELPLDIDLKVLEELRSIQAGRTATAEELLDACEARLLRPGSDARTGEERDVLVRKISLALIGTAQDIDRRLPVEGLRDGSALLRVRSPGSGRGNEAGRSMNSAEGEAVFLGGPDAMEWWESEVAVAFWDYLGPQRAFELAPLVAYQAETCGELSTDMSRVLAGEVVRRLLTGEIVLNGLDFVRVDGGEAWYERTWKFPLRPPEAQRPLKEPGS